MKTKNPQKIDILHLKYVFDIYVEDILRNNKKINWLEELQEGVSTENLHINELIVSSGGLVYYIVDYDVFSPKYHNEDEVTVLQFTLFGILETSMYWKMEEENIPELEKYIFTNFKTVFVPKNRRRKLLIDFVDR